MKPTEFFKKIVASMRSQGLPEDRGLALDNTQALWDYLRADEPVKEERYLKWSDALKLRREDLTCLPFPTSGEENCPYAELGVDCRYLCILCDMKHMCIYCTLKASPSVGAACPCELPYCECSYADRPFIPDYYGDPTDIDGTLNALYVRPQDIHSEKYLASLPEPPGFEDWMISSPGFEDRLRQQREADLQRRQAEAEERERRYRPLTEHARTLKLPQLDEDALNAQDEVTFDLLWNRQLAFQVQGPRDSEETSIAGAAYGGLVESWYGDLPKRAEDRLDAPEEDSAPENSAESDPCIPETRSCRRCSRVDTNNMVVCSASSHSKDTSSFWYHYRCVGLKTATVPKDDELWYCPRCNGDNLGGEGDDKESEDEPKDSDFGGRKNKIVHSRDNSRRQEDARNSKARATTARRRKITKCKQKKPTTSIANQRNDAVRDANRGKTTTQTGLPKVGNDTPKTTSSALQITASSAKRNPKPWNDNDEKCLVKELMEEVIAEGTHNHTEERWTIISDRLRSRYSMDRSWTAVKNYWNREGRQATGIDERRVAKPDRMTTGIQDPASRRKGRKRKRRKGGENEKDSDSESDLEAPSKHQKTETNRAETPKHALKDADDLEDQYGAYDYGVHSGPNFIRPTKRPKINAI